METAGYNYHLEIITQLYRIIISITIATHDKIQNNKTKMNRKNVTGLRRHINEILERCLFTLTRSDNFALKMI